MGVYVVGKERCSGGGLVYANYYFGQQPKLTDSLYKGNTNRHRGTITSAQGTPKGAFRVLATIDRRIPRAIHVPCTQLSRERTAASPRALMSCTTDAKRQAKSPCLQLSPQLAWGHLQHFVPRTTPRVVFYLITHPVSLLHPLRAIQAIASAMR
jgi:hypothetical protein